LPRSAGRGRARAFRCGKFEGGVNSIRRHVAGTTTLNRSAAVPFVIPSEPGFPATQHRTGPRVRLSVRKGA
jgi:hypothetical protein